MASSVVNIIDNLLTRFDSNDEYKDDRKTKEADNLANETKNIMMETQDLLTSDVTRYYKAQSKVGEAIQYVNSEIFKNHMMENGIIDIIMEYFHCDKIITDDTVYFGCDCYGRSRIYIIEKLSDIEYDKTTLNVAQCSYKGRYIAPYGCWQIMDIEGTISLNESGHDYSISFDIPHSIYTWKFELKLPLYQKGKCEWNNWNEWLNRIRLGGLGYYQYRIDLLRVESLTGMVDENKYKQQTILEGTYPDTFVDKDPEQCVTILKNVMNKTDLCYQ